MVQKTRVSFSVCCIINVVILKSDLCFLAINYLLDPSIRARYNDDRFGLQGGYGVELFNEYIGVDEEDENEPVIADDVEDERVCQCCICS